MQHQTQNEKNATRQLEGISLEIFLTFEMHTDLPAAVLNMSA